MVIPILHGFDEKVAAIYDFLTEGSESMLFVVGFQGHEGKRAATRAAVDRWTHTVGIDNVWHLNICSNTGIEHKESFINRLTREVKIIVHIGMWDESWIAMAQEWGARTVIFRRPIDTSKH
jgi:hypothetical protein